MVAVIGDEIRGNGEGTWNSGGGGGNGAAGILAVAPNIELGNWILDQWIFKESSFGTKMDSVFDFYIGID